MRTPDEIKKENIVKPVVEKIPEKIYKDIQEIIANRGNLLNQMLRISVQRVELETKQKETLDKIKSKDASLKSKIQIAAKKLRLQKRKNYRWQYNGNDAFIGNLIPEIKQVDKK